MEGHKTLSGAFSFQRVRSLDLITEVVVVAIAGWAADLFYRIERAFNQRPRTNPRPSWPTLLIKHSILILLRRRGRRRRRRLLPTGVPLQRAKPTQRLNTEKDGEKKTPTDWVPATD